MRAKAIIVLCVLGCLLLTFGCVEKAHKVQAERMCQHKCEARGGEFLDWGATNTYHIGEKESAESIVGQKCICNFENETLDIYE